MPCVIISSERDRVVSVSKCADCNKNVAVWQKLWIGEEVRFMSIGKRASSFAVRKVCDECKRKAEEIIERVRSS